MARRTNILDLTAAAARVGIKKPSVLEAVARGRLKRRADNLFDVAAVDAFIAGRGNVRGGARRGRDAVRQADGNGAPPPAVTLANLPATVLAGGIYADRAAAELARDSYMARLRQLEFEERSGKLVEVAKVKAAISAACAQVRTRLLALPSEKAPLLARLKTAGEIQAALQDAIHEALEELSASFAEASDEAG